ncbi:MAG TPA: carboxypeptidase regulatory-like domain-containing protein [Gemmatimonadaceae bacterium]
MRSLLLLALFVTPASLSAQQAPQAAGHAVVTGVAVDSVRGGYLRGAIVSVSGTTLSAITDSVGRFRIDSVPAGSRFLEVMDPLLDSISLKVRTAPRDLKPGDTTAFILSVPSPATIVTAKCTAADLSRGAGALLGTVTDADTGAPSAGATVTVEWTDIQLTNKTLARLPQRRIATVRSDGTYRVCGVPDDLVTSAIAIRGADSTGAVTVNFGRKLAIASFELPPAGAPAPAAADSTGATARGTATLTGRITDASGTPLANARVAVEADNAATTTDNGGNFKLTGLRAGTRLVSVRRIGFASLDVPVNVSAKLARSVTLAMSTYVAVLDAVRVTAIREIGLQRVGFTDREKSGNGKYFGPDDIARRNPQRLNNLLETVTALRVGTTNEGKRYLTGRHNGCVNYFVDGTRWFTAAAFDPDMSPDNFLSGAELGAVEVYDELTTPAQFMAPNQCATVVIWTKNKLGT